MYKVMVTDDRYGSYLEEENVLKEIDAHLEILEPEKGDGFLEKLKQADALLVNLYKMDKSVISTLSKCRVISRYGVGFDNVDVEAATQKGIWVARVPDYATEDVSDHALSLLLGCIRNIAYKDRMIRGGGWNLHKKQSTHRIQGKVLGLIGYGAISRAFHRKTSGLGLSEVYVYDPYVSEEAIKKAGGIKVDLKDLLKKSDYISIHAPLTDGTRNLIGSAEIDLMKKGAILVNTSRGPLLDEKALAKALMDKRIAGAGLDVFAKEPLPGDSLLRTLDNVVLSDHTGWYSEESVVELKTKAAKNIVSVFKTGKPMYFVNEITPL